LTELPIERTRDFDIGDIGPSPFALVGVTAMLTLRGID